MQKKKKKKKKKNNNNKNWFFYTIYNIYIYIIKLLLNINYKKYSNLNNKNIIKIFKVK